VFRLWKSYRLPVVQLPQVAKLGIRRPKIGLPNPQPRFPRRRFLLSQKRARVRKNRLGEIGTSFLAGGDRGFGFLLFFFHATCRTAFRDMVSRSFRKPLGAGAVSKNRSSFSGSAT